MGKDKDDVEVPSVRELEALEQQERKETADLLSGFDRPGRTPRAPGVRDFVDYYSSPSGRGPAASRAPRREEASPHEKATVVVPRKNGLRPSMTWALAAIAMILFGAAIAVLATPTPPVVPQAMPTIAPTSATTITSATPQPVETAEPETTATDTVITAPPPKKATASTTITSGASSAPTIQTAPRDDFIRDL